MKPGEFAAILQHGPLRAALVYYMEPCKRTFEEDLLLHVAFGYVFSTPDCFVMGRPVKKGAPYEEVTNPRVKFEDADAWLVYLAGGNFLDTFIEHEPYPLPWIGWEKDNVLRWYKRERLVAHVKEIAQKRKSEVLQGGGKAGPTASSPAAPGSQQGG